MAEAVGGGVGRTWDGKGTKKALPEGGAAKRSQEGPSGLDVIPLDATAQLAAEAEGHTGAEDGQRAGDFVDLLVAVLEGVNGTIAVVHVVHVQDGGMS